MTRASVQAVRLDVEAIEHDMLRFTGGAFRAVLEVTGTSSPLDDDAHQEAILAGFATFLNALGYPIQILVRCSPVDLSRYVASLQEHSREALPPELVGLARDHAAFVQALARQRTLLERRFYAIVPAESLARPSLSTWLRQRTARGAAAAAEASVEVDAARRQLKYRCAELSRQLARCGLSARRLSDLELGQLLLACWSPERARVQRLRQRLDDYTSLAVHGAAGGSD